MSFRKRSLQASRASLLSIALMWLFGVGHSFVAPLTTFSVHGRHTWLSSPRAPLVQVQLSTDDGYDGLGEYDPSEDIRPEREVVVGDPQLRVKEKDRSVTSILRELAAIQQQGPQKYCILGTRHCSFLHQQIIELL